MHPNEAQSKNLRSLLAPAPEEKLIITPASPLANSVKNDSPELLDQCRSWWAIAAALVIHSSAKG
jgi:putative SOS response-associated peptidase YedK